MGWSDVYPPLYPEQYLDVTGLRGCFAYRETADPRNGVYESNERNNSAQVIGQAAVQAGPAALPAGGGHATRPAAATPRTRY